MDKPKLIIGNLKMNLETMQTRDEYLRKSLEAFGTLSDVQKSAIVVCPPHLYIESFVEAYKYAGVTVGGQDAHHELRGKFTGSTSAKAMFSLGVQCTILGHSERRADGESAALVAQKMKTALLTGLTPIICVGYAPEGADESKSIEQDVGKIAQELTAEQLQRIIFAYEPVWAIGSGKTPTPTHIHTMTLVVRKAIDRVHPNQSNDISVLYGGSVTTENVRPLCNESHVDGVLVGGASMDPMNLAQMSKLLNP